MPHKKKVFSKENSEKFLLLRGSSQAVNADGETLQNVFVPVSKNYKPGTSLLMSNIATLSCLELDGDTEEHKDIEGIFDDASMVDDSDAAEVTVEDLLILDRKKLKFSRKSKKETNILAVEDRESNSKQNDLGNTQKCSENLKMFNDKFDKIFKQYYDDDDNSSLDGDDDMQSPFPDPFAPDIEDHFEELELVLGDYDKKLKEKILNYVEDCGDEKIVEIVTEKPSEYDCESILSTYSNKYNHPTSIKEEKIQRIRNTSHSESDNESLSEKLSNTYNIRKKDETPEEKKERQRRFKEAKKLRRELKKQNKEAFKEEKKSQSLKDQKNAGMKLL